MNQIFVTRQPIFDSQWKVVGYELLYSAAPGSTRAIDLTPTDMSSSVIIDSVLGMGLGFLTEGRRAFINLSEDLLLADTVELLDPAAVVIEILESVRPTPMIIDHCRALVDKGYTLALDDFVYDEAYDPLLELAEIVKVDVLDSDTQIDETLERLEPFDIRLLAERVEDLEMHDRCVEQGFEYFQGFHYFRPETLTKRDLSAGLVAIIHLMNLLQDVAATDQMIEEGFRSDPSLTYKLLRIVNSASLGGRGVQSIRHALRLLGREPLYRWLCLLLMRVGAGGGEMRIEMIKDSLVHGRMCETLGDLIRTSGCRDISSSGSLFLIGLFAHIDQLLGLPVAEILDDIDVTVEVRDALLERAGSAGLILGAVEAYAAADWERAESDLTAVGGDPRVLRDLYLDSVKWAGSRMAIHRDS